MKTIFLRGNSLTVFPLLVADAGDAVGVRNRHRPDEQAEGRAADERDVWRRRVPAEQRQEQREERKAQAALRRSGGDMPGARSEDGEGEYDVRVERLFAAHAAHARP